ncbi:diguanylate cyclase [Oxalobacteraceae bacterium OM1]|nr:diguanylate cyclase [Oxalobacteraceae bacterium OM1]
MNTERSQSHSLQNETRQHWPFMTLYQRFEQVVVLVLSLIIALVIAIALLQLATRLIPLMLGGALDPLDHEVFQAMFGMIMTLLIALEFKHSIVRVVWRAEGIVQVKTVILIALLALSRKFIILDIHSTDAATIAALASATLALGLVYWLVKERDDRRPKPQE